MIKEYLNKDGGLDMRFAENQHYEARNLKRGILGAIILAFLLACAGMTFIMRPRSVKENIFESVEVEEVELVPTIGPVVPLKNMGLTSWTDYIRAIFAKDEAGRMVRICLKESGNKSAIHYNTNGTYDYSYCQINSIHKPGNMSDFEWKQYLENPTNHAKEVRRIFLSQGWGAWVVASRTP